MSVSRLGQAQRARSQGNLRLELIALLVRKDLKVKYQGSAVGFAWSLANPLIMLGIYYVIFTKVYDNPAPAFHVYLMAGLLSWTAFNQGVSGAAGSVVASGGLVKKVRFPLLSLPLSAIGFALVQLALQMPVLLGIALVSGINPFQPHLILIIPAALLLILFTTALGIMTAAINVRYRDTTHLVEVAMLAWFWLNPILYPAWQVKDKLVEYGVLWVYFLNPMASVVATFQRAVYGDAVYLDGGTRRQLLMDDGYAFYLAALGVGYVISGGLLWAALRIFHRLSADFAEDL